MPNINYVNRTFPQLRSDLIALAKNYFPDTYNDFSPTSPGMMFIEMAAYVGDILSFYQDTQIQESYTQYAQNPENVYSLAYMFGYRPRISVPARVDITFSANTTPTGTTLMITPQSFISDTGVEFALLETTTIRNTADAQNIYSGSGTAISATTRSETLTPVFNGTTPYETRQIRASNIIGIKSLTGPNNETWTEVPYLGYPSENTTKFVTRFDSFGNLNLYFGAGTTENNRTLTDEIGESVLIDPSSYLATNGYGEIPNGSFIVTYWVGGGVNSNVPANSITGSLNVGDVTVNYSNPAPASGGRSADTLEELRQNTLATFGAQGRAVTLRDYEQKALEQTGVKKAYAKRVTTSDIELYVLGENSDGLSIVTDKNSIAQELSKYTLLGIKTTIKDAFVVNIRVDYEIVLIPEADSKQTLLRCNAVLADALSIENMHINKNLNLSKTYSLLDRVEGVQTVRSIELENLVGISGDNTYSNYRYDIKGATRANVVYPSFDPCIFEIKNPDTDIRGRVVI